MAPRHTDSEYETELATLRERLLLMAGRVETMISAAIRALVERDPALARETIASDAKVNRDEIELDAMCRSVLARRQPVASDLRFITQAFKMVTDLERIGDLAVNIAERAIDLAAEPELKPYQDIPRMATLVQTMIRDAIDAFVSANAERAKAVIVRDDEVDALYTRVFRDVLAIMLRDPGTVERGIHVQSVAKWLERIADHTTNLAEQVIFLVRAEDVRHAGKIKR